MKLRQTQKLSSTGRKRPKKGFALIATLTLMMLLAMLLTLVTGAMFRRVRCVWGCAVAHFAFGFFPLCFGL